MATEVRITNIGKFDLNVNEVETHVAGKLGRVVERHTIAPGKFIDVEAWNWRRYLVVAESAAREHCIICAGGNDLPEGEECQSCGRVGAALHTTSHSGRGE